MLKTWSDRSFDALRAYKLDHDSQNFNLKAVFQPQFGGSFAGASFIVWVQPVSRQPDRSEIARFLRRIAIWHTRG